jgi:long-subunit acyl-CoA synthetase (AMP-forming)
MKNELSHKIFACDLSKTCFSEDFSDAITYQELMNITDKLKTSLCDLTTSNCRVGLYSENDRVYALYALGLMETCIYVPINPKLNEKQLIEVLDLFDVDVLLVYEGHVFIEQRLKQFPKWVFNSIHEFSGGMVVPKQRSDFSIITSTSGTSDQPKAVPLYYASWVYSIDKYNKFFDFDETVKQYVYVHLHRIASLYIILRTWMAHGEVVYHKEKNLMHMIESLKKEEISHINGPPSLFNSIVQSLKVQNNPIKRKHKLQVHTSGAALNQALLNDIKYWLNADVYNNYGLTEVYYIASTYKCKDLDAIHNGQMIIDDYKIVQHELWVKGPQVFKGYLSSDSGFEQEWFKTGDLVEFDEHGYCKVIGRLKEFINRGGEKISPYLIEKLIESIFPEIKQCIVFPIPNTYGSDDVGCAIVSDKTFELKTIRNHLLHDIDSYKCPTQLFQLKEIPLSNDKISRNSFYEKYLLGKGEKNEEDFT